MGRKRRERRARLRLLRDIEKHTESEAQTQYVGFRWTMNSLAWWRRLWAACRLALGRM